MLRSTSLGLTTGAIALGLLFTGCGSGESPTGTGGVGGSCSSAFCGNSTSTSNATSGGTAATSGTGGDSSTTTTTATTTTGGVCVEAWQCTPWETDGTSDDAKRTCSDLAKCGTTNTKPTEAAVLPKLDVDYYKCNVEPILDRSCAHMGCHGTETGRALRVYARGRLRHTGEMLPQTTCGNPNGMVLSDKCIGSIECGCFTAPHTATEWSRNFDAARGLDLDANGMPLPAGMEDTSDLIAQPIVGGKAHAGVHLFAAADPEHATFKSWLGGATLGKACVTDN
jgi:hypothetical protein